MIKNNTDLVNELFDDILLLNKCKLELLSDETRKALFYTFNERLSEIESSCLLLDTKTKLIYITNIIFLLQFKKSDNTRKLKERLNSIYDYKEN